MWVDTHETSLPPPPPPLPSPPLPTPHPNSMLIHSKEREAYITTNTQWSSSLVEIVKAGK